MKTHCIKNGQPPIKKTMRASPTSSDNKENDEND